MSVISILDLGKYIVASCANKEVTPMKLQKLAYYVKVWTLVSKYPVILDSDDRNAKFNRWDYGPVNEELFHSYKQFGKRVIVPIDDEPVLKPEDKEIVDFILENYADYSAIDLSVMTHNEEPWQKTSSRKTISDMLIESYYSKEPFAKNFIDFDLENKPFFMLRDQTWHAFTMDMSNYDKELSTSIPSYKEYKQLKHQAEIDIKTLTTRE